MTDKTYPTQAELDDLQSQRSHAVFDPDRGTWTLTDGTVIPCCDGCGGWPLHVHFETYPDPSGMGAPSDPTRFYLCPVC
jgi:hypothetical protein